MGPVPSPGEPGSPNSRVQPRRPRGARMCGTVRGPTKSVGHASRKFCPGGTSDNSPAFQRRVGQGRDPRPEGTTEDPHCFQPSLRDGPHFRFADPALKRRAILGSPFGAKRRRKLTDSFNRTRPQETGCPRASFGLCCCRPARVAQLDRASASGAEGCGFDPRLAYHTDWTCSK